MGEAVLAQIAAHEGAVLLAALMGPRAQGFGDPAAHNKDVLISTDISAALKICDVLIDFSAPQVALDTALMMSAGTQCKAFVTGTTGFSAAQEKALAATGAHISLVKSGNFSMGICLLEALVEQAARALNSGWDIDVLDIHHRHKKDAPSGTALMLGEAVKKGRELDTPPAYKSVRRGDIIGEHRVTLASELESLTLTHTANDRAVFAKGALSAALWAVDKKPGLYDMGDVLGL